MLRFFTFLEHGGYLNGDSGLNTSSSIRGLSDSPQFAQYIESATMKLVPGGIFDITPTKIRARHYVGIVRIGNYQFEILPKLAKAKISDTETLRRNLVSMLSVVHELNMRDVGMAEMGSQTSPFFELLITMFVQRLYPLLRNGMAVGHHTVDDNIARLRGKLLFREHIKKNWSGRNRFFCSFDEVGTNIPLNQLLKFVTKALERLSINADNRSLLKKIERYFYGVNDRSFSIYETDGIVLRPDQNPFLPVLSLARLFVSHSAMSTSSLKSSEVGLLFDMNKLFEEYLFKILQKNRKELHITKLTYQKQKPLSTGRRDWMCSEEFEKKNQFRTYSDLIVELEDGRHLVLDVKYKQLDEGRPHFGITNQDVYQVLSYRTLHSQRDCQVLPVLVYPQFDRPTTMSFQITGSGQEFFIMSINLQSAIDSVGRSIVDELGTYFPRLRMKA